MESTEPTKPPIVFQVDPVQWIPLVCRIALKYVRDHQPVEDSWEYSDGMEALLKAAAKFNPDRGIKFMTYAYVSIERGIQRGWTVRNKRESVYDRTVGVHNPIYDDNDHCDWFDWEEFEIILQQLNPKEVHAVRNSLQQRILREMAVELGVTKERVRQIREKAYVKIRKAHNMRQILSGEKSRE